MEFVNYFEKQVEKRFDTLIQIHSTVIAIICFSLQFFCVQQRICMKQKM